MTPALVGRCLAVVTPATVLAFTIGCASVLLFLYCLEIAHAVRTARRRPARAPRPFAQPRPNLAQDATRPGRHEHTRPRYYTRER